MKRFIISTLVYIFLSVIVLSTLLIDKEITESILYTLAFILLCIVSEKITKWLTK